jgi:hypothetical protein
MTKRYLTGFAITCTCLLAGCQATLYSNERVRADTAGVLGVAPESVTIDNRRSSGATTYYTAEVKGQKYACSTIGGSIMNFGMSVPPSCRKPGERAQPTGNPLLDYVQ